MLRRTPFKRKPPAPYVKPERVPRPAGKLYRPFNGPRFDDVVALPKREYVRSRPLLEACRLIACQHSGIADGTVCAAHSNWSVHGKAKSLKADDNRVAALCASVHSMLDQGSSLSEDERKALWWNAHVRTVRELLRRKLWPRETPVPDIANNPFNSATRPTYGCITHTSRA